MATALFVCLHNAGRSQMSAALFDRAAGGRHHALSAGTLADPDGRVHPEVVEVLREIGIDLSERRPQRLTDALAQQADVIVAMGCGDACPYIPGKRYVNWELDDPKGRPIDEVRATRDDIARRVKALVGGLDAMTPGPQAAEETEMELKLNAQTPKQQPFADPSSAG
jgi:protein-tyrosine-phosphatase